MLDQEKGLNPYSPTDLSPHTDSKAMTDTVLLHGGQIWGGTGGPAFPADVLLQGSRIAAVGRDLSRDSTATQCIDVSRHTVIPSCLRVSRDSLLEKQIATQ
jgi:hypothetical protein